MVVLFGCRTSLPRRTDVATCFGRSPPPSRHLPGLTSLSRTVLLLRRGHAGQTREEQSVQERKAAQRETFRKNMIARFGSRFEEVPNINILLYEEAVRNGYPASYTEFLVERQSKNRKAKFCGVVSTLNLEKGLAQEQFLHLVPLGYPENPKGAEVRWSGQVIYGHQRLGSCQIWKALETDDRLLCPYFDRQAGLLRFRRKDGKDSKWSVDLIHSAYKISWRPFLLLANAEGYLKHCPDGYLRTLDREKLLDEGYYLRGPIEKFRGVRLQPKESRSKSGVLFAVYTDRSQLLPGQTHFRGFPYIDRDDRLRFWNVDSKSDTRFCPQPRSGTSYSDSFSAAIIKRVNPKFFGLAQRLGYWNSI